jgi:hypothetical protein
MLNKKYKYLIVSFLVAIASCKPPPPTPMLLITTWKPGTVLLNNTGNNLGANGQPYQNFRLKLDGSDDDSGTFTLSGIPDPYGPGFSGNWTRNGTTIQLSGVSNGFQNLTNVSYNDTSLNFQVSLTSTKTGNLVLNFSLVKQ